ncbi:MAG: hypothetical protein JRN59_00825 [Nitrososphaerota archaeon]|nr:hypothetical protein [Nitrososphaerota archaeon]
MTSTQTTTETSTSTETGATATAGLVPTASSLICRAAADDSYHCTDNVYSADLGVLQGSVSWTSSDSGGSFTDERCAPTQQQWIQGSPAEVTCTATYAADTGSGASAIQNITAAYSGDAYHASSSQTYTLFVGQSTSPTVFVSVECNDPYPQTGQSEPCTATVTDANGLGLNGTVSWTVSPGQAGSFSEASQSADQCSRQGGDGQGVTLTCQVGFDPSAGGVAVITAAYSHDADHSNGSGSFALYPQDTSSYLASGFNYMLGGSILGGGVAIAAVGLSKRKRDQRQSR